jgi:hypothetical protein
MKSIILGILLASPIVATGQIGIKAGLNFANVPILLQSATAVRQVIMLAYSWLRNPKAF